MILFSLALKLQTLSDYNKEKNATDSPTHTNLHDKMDKMKVDWIFLTFPYMVDLK